MIMTGWPLTKEEVPVCIHEYWNHQGELNVQDGLMYKGMKVIVPASMRPQMIARAPSSHLGPDTCVRRACDVLFWPNMADQIKDQVCNDFLARQQKEPLMTHKIPETPWSKVSPYRDYFELDLLSDTTAESVINATKRHITRHGIADMVTDNGPQYYNPYFKKNLPSKLSPNAESPTESLSDAKADSPLKQRPAMTKTHESRQKKSTTVAEIVTLQPQQTVVTRSGRASVRPSRFDEFVT